MALSDEERAELQWLASERRMGFSEKEKYSMVLTEEEKADRPFTVDEAADFLKVNRKTVLKLLNEGKIKGAKIGRDWRISKAELDRLLRGE